MTMTYDDLFYTKSAKHEFFW